MDECMQLIDTLEEKYSEVSKKTNSLYLAGEKLHTDQVLKTYYNLFKVEVIKLYFFRPTLVKYVMKLMNACQFSMLLTLYNRNWIHLLSLLQVKCFLT